MEHLQTHRVILRPFTPADAAEAFACITDRLTRYLAWDPPQTIHEFHPVWEGWIKAARAGTDLHFTARLPETDEFLGLLGLHDIPSGQPEIGRAVDQRTVQVEQDASHTTKHRHFSQSWWTFGWPACSSRWCWSITDSVR